MMREEAIFALEYYKLHFADRVAVEAFDMAIKALEQEPFINKPCVSSEVCEHDKKQALDKIRTEIEQTAKDYDKFDDYRRKRGLWIALDIIDKYRQEG